MDSAKRVMSGTWGEVWLEGNAIAEIQGFKAASKFSKETINMAGQMEEDNKITSISNTGSLTLLKVYSRMHVLIGNAISEGKDIRFTIIAKLHDPDAYGAERVALYNVSFDDLTLADWSAGKSTTIEVPFTFGKYELLDVVKPK